MGTPTRRETERPRLGCSPLSHHACYRMRNRSIPPLVIDALQDFGDSRMVGEGCASFFFTKRGWKAFIAYMGVAASAFERFRNAYVIVAENGTVVTAGWRH
jgi:hypothetical protein